jgi:hypothetical protein
MRVADLFRTEPDVPKQAVTRLPARRVPDTINDDETLLGDAFTVPDTAPADVPAALKGSTDGARARANSE